MIRGGFACLLLLPLLGAQLRGPVMGCVYDQVSGAMRPVLGVPGSAYVGRPILYAVQPASVAPDGTAAVAVAPGGLVWITGLDTPTPLTHAIALDGPLSGSIRWNGDSSAVAVTSGDTLRIYGRSGNELISRASIDLAPLSAAGSILALDRSGVRVLFGIDSAGLYLLSADAPPQLLASLSRPAYVALARQDRDLFVTDRADKRVLQIRDFATSPELLPVARITEDTADVAGLAYVAGNLLVADRGGRRVVVLDPAGLLVRQIDLDFAPDRLETLPGSSVLLLRAPWAAGEPFQVLETGELQVRFVPVREEVSPL
jgi:hypothetical protein